MRARTTSFIVVATLAGAVFWAWLLPLAAWAVQADRGWVWQGMGLLVYRFAAAVCHQLPDRSFSFGTVHMPVCARCAGLYFGGAAMAIAVACHLRLTRTGAGQGLVGVSGWGVSWSPVRVLALAVMPTALTLLYEWTTGQTPGNWIRAAAGVPFGAGVILVIAGEAGVEAAAEAAKVN